jgi:hypothetical protein
MDECKNEVSFKRKLSQLGGSFVVAIPKELLEFLNATEGTEFRLAGYNGKHGKYIALWKDGE